MNDEIKNIKTLVSKNKTNEALMTLHKISKQDREAEITVLTLLAEFNELTVQKNRGTINSNETGIAQSKINVKILNLVDALSNNDKISFHAVYGKKRNVAKQITLLLFALTVLFFLYVGVVLIFFSNSKSDALAISGIGATYGGIICFIALIITLVIRAILNK